MVAAVSSIAGGGDDLSMVLIESVDLRFSHKSDSPVKRRTMEDMGLNEGRRNPKGFRTGKSAIDKIELHRVQGLGAD